LSHSLEKKAKKMASNTLNSGLTSAMTSIIPNSGGAAAGSSSAMVAATGPSSGSSSSGGGGGGGGVKRKEIYKYEAPWTVFSMNWSMRPDKRFRLALGSFVEEYNNKVQIVSLDENASEFAAKSTFDHPYPTTKIMWIPDTKVR
jgi:hypothetical protein